MSAPYLAVDFGTSNCAAGFMLDQQPHLLALRAGWQPLFKLGFVY